jgi:hypothetical protein
MGPTEGRQARDARRALRRRVEGGGGVGNGGGGGGGEGKSRTQRATSETAEWLMRPSAEVYCSVGCQPGARGGGLR